MGTEDGMDVLKKRKISLSGMEKLFLGRLIVISMRLSRLLIVNY